MYQSENLEETLSNCGIQCSFIPKGAPWYEGWWERLIAPTKIIQKKILGCTLVDKETLQAAVTEIGKILNDRPLTDINDSESLTPSHLLYGRITSLAYLKIEIEESNIPVCMGTSMLTKCAQILNTVLEHFWTRWKSKYLTSSREYHKTSGRNDQTIQIGDIVQVHDRRHVQNDKMAAS